jgi:hypothetical protein
VLMYLKISQYVLAGLGIVSCDMGLYVCGKTYEHWNRVTKKQATFSEMV